MNKREEKIDLKLLLTALDSSHDGIHILDRDGNTLYINETCCLMEGVNKEEIYTKTIRQLVKEGIYSESVTLKVLETEKQVTLIQTANNGRQLLVTGNPIIEDGIVRKVLVNSRDITELESLKMSLDNTAKEAQKYKEELEAMRREHVDSHSIVAHSLQMQRVLKRAANVAMVDSTIIITGESGVGKGMVAKYVHQKSQRCNNPFITIDCSAIPENLFESELFGYEPGAFTGAQKKGKIGLLELADGGTVFLDEIGDMPLVLQAKMMRAIQEKTILPVGGSEYRSIDVRYISATNKNLKELVEKGLFRNDLYFRLNVFPIHIPPLRERKEDIIHLIMQTIDRINAEYKWNKHFSGEAINEMVAYTWPGNIRELQNAVERALISTNDEIVGDDEIRSIVGVEKAITKKPSDAETYKHLLGKYDLQLLQILIEEEGSIPKAAKKIGVYPSTIRRKLEKYKEYG